MRRLARELRIERWQAEATPAGKLAYVRELQRLGARVAMVGDGINDAPVLAQADVSLAMASGADVARMRADMVLLADSPGDVAGAVECARKTRAVVRQNLAWAFGYNVVLIPVAAGALFPAFGLLLSPMVAAGAMALSSVSDLTNALRLRGFRDAAFQGARP